MAAALKDKPNVAQDYKDWGANNSPGSFAAIASFFKSIWNFFFG